MFTWATVYLVAKTAGFDAKTIFCPKPSPRYNRCGIDILVNCYKIESVAIQPDWAPASADDEWKHLNRGVRKWIKIYETAAENRRQCFDKAPRDVSTSVSCVQHAMSSRARNKQRGNSKRFCSLWKMPFVVSELQNVYGYANPSLSFYLNILIIWCKSSGFRIENKSRVSIGAIGLKCYNFIGEKSGLHRIKRSACCHSVCNNAGLTQ